MRRAVGLLVLGVLAAALAAASARAGETSTTATTTTTTTTTTTAAATPSYAALALSTLPATCVGAGAAALIAPSHPVITLGTPGSSLGASAYSTASGPVLSFDSAGSSGSTCKSAAVTLSSVSLFGGVVTAGSVQATDGKGTVTGLQIDGSAVSAARGQTVSVDDWGQLTIGETIGRVTATLVLRLLQAHDSLAAGTAVVVAFAASAQPVASPKTKQHPRTPTRPQASGAPGSRDHPSGAQKAKKHGQQEPQRPTPAYPSTTDPLLTGGRFTDAARDNPVVSTALQYLGIPYQWGGAAPKSGFDCSGLVQYVFAQLGVSLPHYAAAQYHSPNAVYVAPNRLEPGDLVFFTGADGTRKEPGHVGIYVGDGYLIDAPHTGGFVQIDSLDEGWFANKYVAAKKIVAHLDARRLLHATDVAASVPTTPRSLSLQVPGGSFAGGLPLIAAEPTAAHTSPTRGYGLWAGVGLGGALLLLLSGTITYIRRRNAGGGT